MVALHDLHWNFLFSDQMICKQHIILNHMFFRYESDPPFWLNIVLDVPRLKITQTHMPHNYTSQIIFFVQPMLWVTVKESGYQHTHLANWTYVKIILVLFTFSVRVNNPWPNTIFFGSPKLSLSFFNCSCSPMNVKMEQKGQPYISKFYQLSNITSSPIVHFLFFFYMFTNFMHHQILQYTKDTKSNSHNIYTCLSLHNSKIVKNTLGQ